MTAPAGVPGPLQFFDCLRWIDGRPLSQVIEPYRARIFEEALYRFDPDGRPQYNLILAGRAKKCWKSADLVLAALYRFLVWQSPLGNDAYILANDEDQAGDDLGLAKKLLEVNPDLASEVEVRSKEIERRDGRGVLKILPAKDVSGAHGKAYGFIGYDEIHGYRTWDIMEALQPDPTRPDALQWVTSYASIFNSPGAPLYDLTLQGKQGNDPRMLFSWYAGDHCTDPAFAELEEPESRANPSQSTWEDDGYLAQQKRRLPSHKYRRLHLNLPGLPDGAAFDADAMMDAIVIGRRKLAPEEGRSYVGFVDMSGGSGDDATLAIAHRDQGRAVLDLVTSQQGKAPFNPRRAVKKFALLCKEYGISRVTGDAYGGETFRADFLEHGIDYTRSRLSKSEIYEAAEPLLNAQEVELLDVPKLQEQALGLVWRGTKIDHQAGEHDDFANAAFGAVWLVTAGAKRLGPQIRTLGGDQLPIDGSYHPWTSVSPVP